MDDKNNINEQDDNLEHIAPRLSALKKEQGFGMPGDFFDSLADKIQQKCADADELREIAPVLSEIPKYNPFAVPDGYFDELPALVQERCIASQRKASWAGWLARLLRPRFAAAAVAIVLVVITITFLMNGNDTRVDNTDLVADNKMAVDSIAADTAFDLEGLYSLDETALFESLDGEQVAQMSEDAIDISEEEVMDYLLENNVDVSSLVNEL